MLRPVMRIRPYGINPLLIVVLIALSMLLVSRFSLFIWQWDEIPPGSFFIVLLQGLRVDIATVCGLFALPMLLLLIGSAIPSQHVLKAVVTLIKLYCSAALVFLLLNEAATPEFMNEFGVRPNHLYVQYLIYPKEVMSLLWNGHRGKLIFIVIVAIAALIGFYMLCSRLFKDYQKGSLVYNVLSLVAVVIAVPMGIRSTFGHRPMNPAMISFCNNALANTIPLNSSYSAVYAAFHLSDLSVNSNNTYKIVPDDEALRGALELSARSNDANASDKCPINQQVVPFEGVFAGFTSDMQLKQVSAEEALKAGKLPREEPYNVVVILEESFGDNFIASQGGADMAPNIERLKEKAWWFDNLYAAGHRSIRGIEAVTASYPPSSLLSIVKLQQPQDPYASLATIFKQSGYETSFIYGGESHFDNMRGYFYSNGVDKIVEQKDYENPSFVATWGVSDEDLFNRANELYKSYNKENKRFFSVVFSSSFHDPFDIPEGKVSIDGYQTDEPKRYLAVKYADYALGKFFDKALAEEYSKNTIFLVIADHESRVRGGKVFPAHDFEIPALIIAPNVMPYDDKRQVSQIDMGMTLLSLAGINGSVPNVGQNLTRADIKERGVMQFNDIFALVEGNRMVELAPEAQAVFYTLSGKKNDPNAVKDDNATSQADMDMLDRAVRYSNIGPYMYKVGAMSSNCISLTPAKTNQTPDSSLSLAK